MASETEASCESDPNFAIICAFLEKFGETCGVDNIDFVELQQMLENNQEVSPELVNLHIKLLRKTKKKVTPERWERALINMCHTFSSKDAWEIERFGYKKTRLRIKLRALKELLEMQFDYNTKFKNDVNKMTAEDLRSQPLGRDKLGRAYWFQTDNNYQVRVYKEDPDEETWNLIAKDREGLMSLITELTDGDSKLSSDSACNEDSNSLLEKPFIDTGQTDNSKDNDTNNEDNNIKENKEDKPQANLDEELNFEADETKKLGSTGDLDNEDDVKIPSLRIKTLSELKESSEESNSTNEEPTNLINKKPRLESPENRTGINKEQDVSSAIESPTILTQGEGSGEDNQSGNIEVSDEIEDPVLYFYGSGSGKDCGMGNEKEPSDTKNCDSSKSDNGESANQANNYKLGTIIDSKTDNKIFLPRDPKKKSRWDQKETEMSDKESQAMDDSRLVPKKPTFFFGPGSLNVTPSTLLNSEAQKLEKDIIKEVNKESEDEGEVQPDIEIVKDKVPNDEQSSESLVENQTSSSKGDENNSNDSKTDDDSIKLTEQNDDREKCDSQLKIDDPSSEVPNIEKHESACTLEQVIEVPSSISKQEECNETLNVVEDNISLSNNDNNEKNAVDDTKGEGDNNDKSSESDTNHTVDTIKFDNNIKVDTDENDNSRNGVQLDVDNNSSLAKKDEQNLHVVDDEAHTVAMKQDCNDTIGGTNEENSNEDNEKIEEQTVNSKNGKNIDVTQELKDEKTEDVCNRSNVENIHEDSLNKEESPKVEEQEPVGNETTPLNTPDDSHVVDDDGDSTSKEAPEKTDIRQTRQTGANKVPPPDQVEPMNDEGTSNKIEQSPSQMSKSDDAESLTSPAPLEAITIVDTDSNSAAADNTETDPLAVSEEDRKSPAKPVSSITNFSFDFNPSSPASDEPNTRRNLRKRGREETKPEAGETSGKKPKMKGKRSIDLNLRKSVEEKRQQEVGEASSDENEPELKKEIKVKGGAKPQGKKKVGTSSLSDTDNASVKSQPTKKNTAAKNKRLLKNLGLNEEDISAIAESPPAPVRQSRRLAQLKIKEEASRRKMEEEEISFKKKKKKEDDKDFKAGKRKRFEEEMKPASIPPSVEKKKKKKKHDKITIGWNTSSEDSDFSGREEEEEGSEYEYDEAHEDDVLQFKSDHEFSPESDLEGDEQMPLKRARTARKEVSDDEDDDADEEFPCQKCGKADHPEWILLCDKCDNGWHCSCLRPALFVIPEGDWYCPTCQHENLLLKLHKKLRDFDKMMAKKEMEDRRKERLAYVGISLNNVLPAKEKKERTPCRESGSEKSSVADTGSESGSGSGDKSDSDEPIYQLRQRRQAHSYKFQDYDDLINSALQEEPTTPVEKTHTLGRGKDIATIVNAAKEEEEKNTENAFEDLPPVVPKDTEESRKKAISYRKKPKRLNNLEVNSDDEADDSDEDFNGSSNEESDEDDFEEDSDDSYVGRKGSRPTRRSTRARTTRFDADFINDDDEDDDDDEDSDDKQVKKKKKRTFYEDSESESSDDWRGKRRSSKKSKKKKSFEDSDLESYRKKKPKIKFGIDNDDGIRGRRTRGKKTSYLDTLGSDSEEENLTKKQTRKNKDSTDDDEYVVEDDKESEEEEAEKESEGDDSNERNSDSEDQIPLKAKKVKIKKRKTILESDDDSESGKLSLKITNVDKEASDSTLTKDVNSELAMKPVISDENEIGSNRSNSEKLEEMNEEYVGKMMENEDYANSQLRLAAIRIQEAKRLTVVGPVQHGTEAQYEDTKKPTENSLKKVRTGRFFNLKPPQESILPGASALLTNDDDNDELSEPPGVVLPIFDIPNATRPSRVVEIPSAIPMNSPMNMTNDQMRPIGSHNVPMVPNNMGICPPIHNVPMGHNVPPTGPPPLLSNASPDNLSKKRRGRGKGKKTLAAEAAANIPEPVAVKAGKTLTANIEIASPPQPFSQSQPAPSVITRMLQTAPGKGAYPVGRIRPKQFAMISDANNDKETEGETPHKDMPQPVVQQLAPSVVSHPAGHYGGPPPGQYVYHHQRPMHPYPAHGGQAPPLEQPLPPLTESTATYAAPPPPTHRQTYPNPAYNYEYNVPPPQPPPPVLNTDDGIPPPVYENNSDYSEHYDNPETGLDVNIHKNIEDEPSGEFGGLVSYFSSQHEDDLDS